MIKVLKQQEIKWFMAHLINLIMSIYRISFAQIGLKCTSHLRPILCTFEANAVSVHLRPIRTFEADFSKADR